MAKRQRRKLISRWRAKWLGVVLTVVLAGLLVATIWISAGQSREGDSFAQTRFCFVKGGAVYYGTVSMDMGVGDDMFRRWFRFELCDRFVWLPSHRVVGPWSMRTDEYVIPLWPLVLLAAFPTAWLWRSDRRIQPWQCRGCRYDLRGLERGGQEGVCPECGLSKGEG